MNVKQFGSRSGPTLNVLICVQTVCKCYQQLTKTALARKEFMYYPNHDCSICYCFTGHTRDVDSIKATHGHTVCNQHKSPAPKKEFKEQLSVGTI